ncbi:MAG: 2-oxo acid dehydrogenase subunit E2 [Sedimentisphaerales bacterium]|nr:2-oxo acid dehydrogenase subunit E2 [Sedimentisphaerales bacterium]
MAEKIPMTALSPTMENGLIAKWRKHEGDAVASGDVICEVETDKATMEYTCMQEGILLKIVLPEGSEAAVGDTIAILGAAGEDISGLLKDQKPAKTGAQSQPKPETEQKESPKVEASQPAPGEHVRSSPLARKLAEQHGLRIEDIPGSGPNGRIVEKDVEAYLAKHPAGPQVAPTAITGAPLKEERIPINPKRRTIAKRLSESKFTSPHYYLKISAAVDQLFAARQRINAGRKTKVSINAFFMKLVAECLRRNPKVNATWTNDEIIRHGRIDMALAVAQEDGLITPVVRNCESKGILAIDEELQGLIDKARTGRLQPEDYTNSTFTITNLGMFGIEEFTAIINPPNSAILAIGAAIKEQVFDAAGIGALQTRVRLTMSCDHRIVDGAVGAAFLRDLKALIEYPIDGWY